ncbi:hypothetical protein SAMN06265365_101342 [Tistlia consotensis]|uniref:Uncharacterized protein n=1 Tax=Tistlia consotensis USBA 355 TaxID=560819 RepID=A0A1Y6B8Y0_9PROT|nr:hypothetical protein [Tistlia consotensis]SME90769.1 hypothetical protein SAMN05428998_101340 [Tistlia consotensis USBA 355]SNR26927.1 hypothetical protein SAMN06265365_101342 [Tistlia consotensis]
MTTVLPPSDPGGLSRLPAALLAGGIAIAANTALLALADRAGLVTAHGGLLRLLQLVAGRAAAAAGLAGPWNGLLLPATSGAVFKVGFHLAVGLVMALVYGFAAEPALAGRPWAKGLLCAVAVWFLNALIVLPAIGEGLAGSRHLEAAGMIGFAAIHTAFFLILAPLYARLRGTPRPA